MLSSWCVPFCLLFIFYLHFILAQAQAIDVNLNVDKSGWVDPLNPLRISQSTTQNQRASKNNNTSEELLTTLPELTQCQQLFSPDDSVDVLLKHVLRKFLVKLNLDVNVRPNGTLIKQALVTIKPDDFDVISRYLSSQKASEEIRLRESLRASLENFIHEDIDDQFSNRRSTLFAWLYYLVPYIVLLNIMVLPPAVLIVVRTSISIRRCLTLVLFFSFAISCYFTYARKYQEVLAQRFERIERQRVGASFGMDGSPCSPQGLVTEAFSILLSYISIKDKSECLRSFEDVLIEPIWLVDPLQVVGEVASNFLLTPLSVSGTHLNKFFNDFFVSTPFHLTVLKAVLIPIVLYLLLQFGVSTCLMLRNNNSNNYKKNYRRRQTDSDDRTRQQAAAICSADDGTARLNGRGFFDIRAARTSSVYLKRLRIRRIGKLHGNTSLQK